MSADARITFAIPYYSNLAYLRQAVDSVVAQTTGAWAVVVVDDAGDEPADQLVARYRDRRITYIRNSVNLGLAGNWNECLRRADTDLVTLLHADDRLRRSYAADVLAAAATAPDAAMIFTDAVIIGPDGRPARSLPDSVKRLARRPKHNHTVAGDAGLAPILANNYVMCPTICYRRSQVGDAPFDGRWRMTLDLDHMARVLLAGKSMYGLRRPLYEYRRHGDNQTASLTADATRFEEEIACYREIAAAADAHGWQRSARVARRRLMVRTHLTMQVAADLLHGRWGAAATKRRLLWSDLRPASR